MPRAQRSDRGPGEAGGSGIAVRLAPMMLLVIGLGSWAYGIERVRPEGVGLYGLLLGTGTAGAFILLGMVLVVAGFLVELRRRARTWMLGLGLIGLIVEIHAAVPIVFEAPEYAWVYKHLGIIAGFQHFGRVTDPKSIYQEWPVLFSTVAAISSLAHVSAASLATWAPLAFELADALLLIAIFRLLARGPRIAWLAILLYEGLISWIGQDYLSPQAFAYTLWLAMMLIVLRWLRTPTAGRRSARTRLHAWLPSGPTGASPTTRAQQAIALLLVGVIFFAITAAHQLTPYAALADIALLTVLDLVRPRWLVLALAAVAGAYLAFHYQLIESQYGGLFSGGNPLTNGSGVSGGRQAGSQATTAYIVRALSAGMWGLTVVSIVVNRRRLGKVVAVPAALALAPFVIVFAQNYGGEAIYRVYLFSAPWCALLIAITLYALPPGRLRALRWPLIAGVSLAFLFGLQGLFGPVAIYAYTPSEVRASQWMYGHLPHGSLIVLPDQNFPVQEATDSGDYSLEALPADPQVYAAWMNEADVRQVSSWLAAQIPSHGSRTGYIVVSASMSDYPHYYGAPRGYDQLIRNIPRRLARSVVYRNRDTTIYQLRSAAALRRLAASSTG